jgi:heme/copper-type cytochrome/quinol oxidase subunit 3
VIARKTGTSWKTLSEKRLSKKNLQQKKKKSRMSAKVTIAKMFSNLIIIIEVVFFAIFMSLYIASKVKDWASWSQVLFQVLTLLVFLFLAYAVSIGMIFRNMVDGTLTFQKTLLYSGLALALIALFVVFAIYG